MSTPNLPPSVASAATNQQKNQSDNNNNNNNNKQQTTEQSLLKIKLKSLQHDRDTLYKQFNQLESLVINPSTLKPITAIIGTNNKDQDNQQRQQQRQQQMQQDASTSESTEQIDVLLSLKEMETWLNSVKEEFVDAKTGYVSCKYEINKKEQEIAGLKQKCDFLHMQIQNTRELSTANERNLTNVIILKDQQNIKKKNTLLQHFLKDPFIV